MKKIKNSKFKQFDFILFFLVLILSIFGFIMIKSATLNYNNPSKYLKSQMFAIILGTAAMIILSFIDYDIWGKLYIPIYIFSNLLLVAVLIWGTGEDDWGSRSWLSIGGFTFQPAEIVKLGLIISLAKFIDINKQTLNRPFTLLKVLAFAGLPILLIMGQPDAGTAMVFIFFIAIMLFTADLDWKYIRYAILIVLIILPLIWTNLDPYQKHRLLNFNDPERDTSDTGYQAIQGKIAIGSGKFFGRGLYKGVQTQYNFVPEKESDFIFAVLVEELGFLGGGTLIFLYLLLLLRLVKISRESSDTFGSLIVIGYAAMLFVHIWENIGMTIGLMPITGIPLPFMSHGGTFLLVNMLGIGLALSVRMHKDGLNF